MTVECSLDEWLDQHSLKRSDICAHLAEIKQLASAIPEIPPFGQPDTSEQFDLEYALTAFVLPALDHLFGPDLGDRWNPAATKITVRCGGSERPPYCGSQNGSAPEVTINKFGTAQDVLHLSRQMALTVQATLSKNEPMPPVARESCAFIGELALLRYLKQQDLWFFDQFKTLWFEHSTKYFGEGATHLEQALHTQHDPFAYCHNRTIARFYSGFIFPLLSVEKASDLFSGGHNAMDIILGLMRSSRAEHLGISTKPLSENDEALRLSLSLEALSLYRASNLKPSRLSQPSHFAIVRDGKVSASTVKRGAILVHRSGCVLQL